MRIKHIDVLRGIAALMVTIFHLIGSTDLQKSIFNFASYGWTGVEVFFVISGFILPYSLYKTDYQINNFWKFILKRVVRIYPAYIVAIILGVTLTVLTGRTLISPLAFASQILFLNDIVGLPSSSVVFWTLAIELQFYILIGLLYPYFLQSNPKSLILILILSILSLEINPGYIIHWFPFFALGILIFNFKVTNLSHKIFWPVIILMLFFIIYTYGVPHAIAALFAILFTLYAKFEKQTLIHKILFFLGTISYSLYLTHWDLGRAAVRVLNHFPIISNYNTIRLLLGIISSIFFAWLLYNIVEKKSIKISTGIKYRKV